MKTQVYTSQIQWRQIWCLMGLDAAIVLSWLAYHKYQPQLVLQFGFQEYTLVLAIVQGLVLCLTPPLAGWISDRVRSQKGSRLSIVQLGISFVAMVFMAVAFTIYTQPSGNLRWIFPVLIVLWLIAMNIFQSPAVSTTELFVPRDKLPRVAALLAIVTNLAYALEPSIVDLINHLGATLTFSLGGIILFGMGWLFILNTRQQETQSTVRVSSAEQTNFGMVLIISFLFGLATTVFFNVLPDLLEPRLSFLNEKTFKGSFFVSILVAVSALVSWPMSYWVEKEGVVTSIWIGFGVIFLASFGIFVSSFGWFTLGLSLLLPFAYSLVSVSTLPLVFVNLKEEHKVLGIGLFFSGVELPNSLVEIMQVMG